MHNWIYVNQIGRGGNGLVWKVKNSKGDFFALKELLNISNSKLYRRFCDEVEILKKIRKSEGIIEIIDYNLPENPTTINKPYYVMPLGTTFTEFIKNKKHDFVYSLFIQICYAVKFLHDNEITHRDIKPANILVVNSKPVLSDFGLVDFPEKKNISSNNEPIGPKWTIAPEMQRISSSAEFKKADIYSLAKTLWIIFTNNKWGFEGQYIANSSISLDKYMDLAIHKMTLVTEWNCQSIVLLERLIIDATSNDVDKRPNIEEFIKRLEQWFRSNDEFRERNPMEWEDALKRIFPVSMPSSCKWYKVDDINSVLKILTQYDNLNYAFLPDNGGMDIKKVEFAKEDNCLVLNDYYIVNPKCLFFECLSDSKWSYFRLELNVLTPITSREGFDLVTIDDEGNYHIRKNESNFYKRYKKGNFVFVNKTSTINSLKGELDGHIGIHNQMNGASYRLLMEDIRKRMIANEP